MAKTYFLHQDLDKGYANKNMYYLLGFDPSLGTVIFNEDRVNLIFDARYFPKIQKISKSRFRKFFGSKIEIKNILLDIDLEIKIDKYIRGEEIVIEKNIPTCMYKKLKELKPESIDIIENIFDKKRLLKSNDEKIKIKKAISIIKKVFKEIFAKKNELVGKTEIEIRKMVIKSIIDNGGDGESFPTIVAFGKNSAIPHHEAGNTKIGNGPLLIDMGASYHGYLSDFTRTFWVGEETENYTEYKKIESIVIKAHNLGVKNLQLGMTGKEVDKIVRDYIDSFGYGKYFTHSTGHGIGLQNHEEPWISERKGDKKLEKGMVFTIEPGIYLPNKFGFRWENIVMV